MNTTLPTANEIDHPYRVDGPVTVEEARGYCERLAKSHYENFLVAGLFCPRALRQHFYNIYAYCRVSDDLGDEIADTRHALILLNWWEANSTPCTPESRAILCSSLSRNHREVQHSRRPLPRSADCVPPGSGDASLSHGTRICSAMPVSEPGWAARALSLRLRRRRTPGPLR